MVKTTVIETWVKVLVTSWYTDYAKNQWKYGTICFPKSTFDISSVTSSIMMDNSWKLWETIPNNKSDDKIVYEHVIL